MEFRPCIDLHSGKVKQIVGSSLDDRENPVENYVSKNTPDYYARLFKRDNLKGGHVIMLGKGNKRAAITALQAYPGGLQVGGGINPKNAKFYLKNGASHVIVTSYVFHDGDIDFERLNELVDIVGRKHLVLDLSCRKKDGNYYVVTDRWQKFTRYRLDKKQIDNIKKYCSEFLVHGVDVEGKKCGIDIELVSILSNYCKIPVTYAGGISSFKDLETIKKVGNNRINVTIGSALDIFGGEMSYRQVIKWFRECSG